MPLRKQDRLKEQKVVLLFILSKNSPYEKLFWKGLESPFRFYVDPKIPKEKRFQYLYLYKFNFYEDEPLITFR